MKIFFILTAIFSLHTFADTTLIYEAEKKGINLTDNDKKVLEVGEISQTKYIIGGVVGTYPIGFGLGHAIQGRWTQGGWIFTAGEVASLAAIVGGVAGCIDNSFSSDKCSGLESTLIVTGVIGLVGFRLWEIVDVWAAPPGMNKKYNELKNYIEKQPAKPEAKTTLDLVPMMKQGFGNGVALRLTF